MTTSTHHEITRVPITLSALVQRLKRRFARDGETFHVARGEYNRDVGLWYAVDERNFVCWNCHTLDDLTEVARELGVLHAYKEVAP